VGKEEKVSTKKGIKKRKGNLKKQFGPGVVESFKWTGEKKVNQSVQIKKTNKGERGAV